MSYSVSTGNVYCVPCKLFSRSNSTFQTGFSDWNHCQIRVTEHEDHSEQRNSLKIWCTQKTVACRLDYSLMKQTEVERKYWRDVLRHTVKVVIFLVNVVFPSAVTTKFLDLLIMVII